MKKVKTIRCTSCGSAEVETIGNGIGKCVHCQSTMLLPRQDEEIIALLNTAHVYRENFNYDLAIKSYQYVLEKDPQELSAYEGILLSEYGIEYVKDTYSSKLVPTCHRAHFKSILEDSNYQALMSLADEQQKQVIEKKALEIDKLQKAIERQLQNEESYDVFISYKANDKNGEKTEDSLIARNIYEELTNKNYKVFFSEKSLEDRLGSEYEPIIFKALHTAKIFILVGTSKENIEATWVRNEWSRFIDRIKNEPQTLNGNNFIPVFKDMNPYDFPKVNNNFVQGVDATKLGYSIAVLDGVQRILKPEKEKKVLDTFDNVDNIEQFEKIRKQRKRELKEKNWKDLQTNPKNKKKKFLYNLFLAMPYIFALISLCMLCDKRTWFVADPRFGFFILFASLTLASAVLTICVHANLYNLRPFIHITFPFSSFVIITIVFVICFTSIPVNIFGASASSTSTGRFYNGLMYWQSGIEKRYKIVSVSSNDNLKYYTKEINGEKHLILPEFINGNKICQYNIYIPDNIDVVYFPPLEQPEDFDYYSACYTINISKYSNLKKIYCSSSVYTYAGLYDIRYNNSVGSMTEPLDDITIYFESEPPQEIDTSFINIQRGIYPYK